MDVISMTDLFPKRKESKGKLRRVPVSFLSSLSALGSTDAAVAML
jgi:hypothetical protein